MLHMSASQCALIAQVLPIFWLVAIVPGRGILQTGALPDSDDRFNTIGLIVCLALAESIALVGAGGGGLNGWFAWVTWGMTFGALALVVFGQISSLLEKPTQASDATETPDSNPDEGG